MRIRKLSIELLAERDTPQIIAGDYLHVLIKDNMLVGYNGKKLRARANKTEYVGFALIKKLWYVSAQIVEENKPL